MYTHVFFLSSLCSLKHTDKDKDTLERKKIFSPEKQNSVLEGPRKRIIIRISGTIELLDQFKMQEFFNF